MRALLSRLAPRDWLIVIGGLAVVAGIEMAKPIAGSDAGAGMGPGEAAPARAAGPPVLYPEAGRRLVHDIAGIDAAQRKAMDETFADAFYFAAFAAGQNEAYGWVRGFSTQVAARTAAMAACADVSPGCRIVAEVVPAAMTVPSENSLTFDQAQAYRRAEAGIGPRAFARSLDGSWAIARNLAAEAVGPDALTRCEAAREIHAFLPPTPCEVIAVWGDDLLPPPGR